MSRSASASTDPRGVASAFIRFRPTWSYIDGIRRFVEDFCHATDAGAPLAERARLVIQETLENAVKYSVVDASNELELTMNTDAADFEISVSSKPDPAHLDALRQQLDELYQRPPKDAYVAAFARAASSPTASARLGLARIRYEGKMDLTLSETGDGRIKMSAKGKR